MEGVDEEAMFQAAMKEQAQAEATARKVEGLKEAILALDAQSNLARAAVKASEAAEVDEMWIASGDVIWGMGKSEAVSSLRKEEATVRSVLKDTVSELNELMHNSSGEKASEAGKA